MKILNKILDNYYTSKVIERIKNKMILYHMKIETRELIDNEVAIYINYIGTKELKGPLYLISFMKNDSFELLINDDFFKKIERELLITMQMFEKGIYI